MTRARTLLTIVACLLVLGSGWMISPAQAQDRDVLIFGMESQMDILDPHAAGGWVTARVNYQMFEGLVGRDLTTRKDNDFIPVLATDWETSKNKRVWTFTLRKGVEFHDGTPFNADAVVFNVRRAWDEDFEYYYPKAAAMSQFHYQYPGLQSVEKLGEYRVRFTFKRPFSELLTDYTRWGMGMPVMISPTAIKKYGNDGIPQHPVGTGPFEFVSRTRGEKIVLKKNEDYWGSERTAPLTPAKLDRLIFRPMPEPSSRVTNLLTGGAHIISVAPPNTIDLLRQRDYQISMNTVNHRWFVFNNLKEEVMQNRKIRKAIYLAVDREGIAEKLLNNTATPAWGYLGPASVAYEEDFKPSWAIEDHDKAIKKARQLIKEAGYEPGELEFTMRGPSEGSGMLLPVKMMEWIARNLGEAGINVKVETYEWITFLTMWNKGVADGVELQVMGSGDAPPPFEVWHSDWWGPKGHNTGYYKNEKVDELLDKAYVAPSTEERRRLLKKAHDIYIKRDVAVTPVVHGKYPLALTPDVKGFVHPPVEWFDLRNVELRD